MLQWSMAILLLLVPNYEKLTYSSVIESCYEAAPLPGTEPVTSHLTPNLLHWQKCWINHGI